ncbi:MAG: DUF3455 domain-containing protein [Polaromonas sp.]|nr:DUF3455 domain-containing protein [Polaromonas sp.]MDP3752459.1 DUF3455 domain-containing protein [Polaromonas sp.]
MSTNPSSHASGPVRFSQSGKKHRLGNLLLAIGSAAVLGGCGSRPILALTNAFAQQDVPATLRVPAGHQPVLQAHSNGRLVYECQAIKRSPFEYEWLARNPDIDLTDARGDNIKHKPGARASWAHRDGSTVQSREFVEVPNGSHNLPLQTYKVEPAAAPGALHNISYVQRLRTVGGWLTVVPCTSAQLGMRVTVPYEADYVFWRPIGS